jgi:hypothetical protein
LEDLARLGLLVTCSIAVYVGVRTLTIWRRTRMAPELLIGLSVLGLSVGGVVLTVMGNRPMTTTTFAPYAFGLAALVVHVGAAYVGNWKIFRPRARWPAVLSCVAIGFASLWAVWALEMPETSWDRTIYYTYVRLIGQAWGMYECFRYSSMLRRRVDLGLAEPMVAHRLWLWGMGGFTQVIVLSWEVVTWYATGTLLAATPMGLHLTSALGLAGITTTALAFFPPDAYVRFVVGHGVATESRA